MTALGGTLVSLRDWVRDQVHEIQNLTPLAVLAPAKCSPVGHVTDEMLPDPDSIAPCAWGSAPSNSDCDHVADWAVRLHLHAPFVWLLCDQHLQHLKHLWLDDFARWTNPLQCEVCGREFRLLADVIESEVRL